ncbi:serine/threonine-protein kinase [Tautonia plasticadhaerens]|nr:serine/threonine-protein kinase [Tautonia plasticadhaerens]
MEAGLPGNGDRLDSFEIQQAIGVGGMGAVFRALDVRLDRFIALKVLPPGQAFEAENVRRFYQEGRAAARLDHENIARVYTIGQDKGLHYIAFEYIDGTTIRQRVERYGPLPVAEAINFTLQIAGALVHASERGVVHRDIKPSNIIVTAHGRAKLVDMGLARRFEREGADDGLTQSNMTLGTFDYISPEQARDPRSVDVRSDLYSLGCTIYHMLTGQPPFPGGTVLQKLLSHREEPAPDVRGLNPAVPADLAAIVLKLMAKDPDRRYQSPEQLVRDLLTLAGALGLRSISPEGLVWMSAAPRAPGWERHLFWGLPAAALGMIVATLVWMGRDPDGDPLLGLTPDPAEFNPPAVPRPADARPDVGASGADRGAIAAPTTTGTGPDLASATSSRSAAEPSTPNLPARVRRVRSDEDLRKVLRSEPPGSTIELADNGPYRLSTAPGPGPIRADLTIRAADDTRPVLQPDSPDEFALDPGPLLHFEGGRVTIEGLTFDLGEAGSSAGPAVRAEGTALTLSRCEVRGAGRPAAIELIAPVPPIGPGASSRSPAMAVEAGRMPVRLETCTLGGGRVGVSARGPVTLGLGDCSIACRGPAIWFNNGAGPSGSTIPDFGFEVMPTPASSSGPPVRARLEMEHVSLVAGAEPVFRFDGTAIQVVASDLLVAPPRALDSGSGRTTLVAIDDPDRLHWMGFGNLYARIGVYLQPSDPSSDHPRIFEFDAWAGGSSIGEVRSEDSTQHVWVEDDPGAALARDLPVSLAFRPASAALPPGDGAGNGPAPSVVGARRGPAGPIEPVEPTVASDARQPDPARLTGFDPDPMDLGPMTLAPGVGEPSGVGAFAAPPTSPGPRRLEPVEGEAPPAFRSFASTDSSRPGADGGRRQAAPPMLPTAEAMPTGLPDAAGSDADAPIRTAAGLVDRLGRLGPKGGVLLLAAGARIDLPPQAVPGSGIVEILAEPGPTRPLLRFLADPVAPAGTGGWSTMLRVERGGELRLRGVDLLVGSDEAPPPGPWAAFGLAPEATLDLTGCSVTVDGPVPSAAVRLLAEEPGEAGSPPEPFRAGGGVAGVRVIDSLIRCSDDVVEVASGARGEVELSNSVVSCGGSLLVGHGRASAAGGRLAASSAPEPRLVLELRRVTVVSRGGIVRLDSAPDQPELPLAVVSARESVLTTGPDGGALFLVDGQGELGTLGDRIRVVESREVAYHLVDEYRRDQTARLDILPQVLDRDEWRLFVGRSEVDARHGDAGFLDDDGPSTSPPSLDPDDLRLDPDGLASDLGPDLDRIPRPPGPETLAEGPTIRPGVQVLDRIRRYFPGLP